MKDILRVDVRKVYENLETIVIAVEPKLYKNTGKVMYDHARSIRSNMKKFYDFNGIKEIILTPDDMTLKDRMGGRMDDDGVMHNLHLLY